MDCTESGIQSSNPKCWCRNTGIWMQKWAKKIQQAKCNKTRVPHPPPKKNIWIFNCHLVRWHHSKKYITQGIQMEIPNFLQAFISVPSLWMGKKRWYILGISWGITEIYVKCRIWCWFFIQDSCSWNRILGKFVILSVECPKAGCLELIWPIGFMYSIFT